MRIVASFDERKGFVSEGLVYRLDATARISQEFIIARFLWDTGARVSAVSRKLAETLDLWTLQTGSPLTGIGGQLSSDDCAALFAIKNDKGDDVWIKHGPFCSYPEEHVPGIDVIIGLDIILEGRLLIEKIQGRPTLIYEPEKPDSLRDLREREKPVNH